MQVDLSVLFPRHLVVLDWFSWGLAPNVHSVDRQAYMEELGSVRRKKLFAYYAGGLLLCKNKVKKNMYPHTIKRHTLCFSFVSLCMFSFVFYFVFHLIPP